MREIKFRAWSKELGMSEPFTLKDTVGSDIDEFDEYVQFTGLLDSAKREIYEGDIVKWDDASEGGRWRVAEVIAEPGHFTFRTIPALCINCYKDESHDFQMGQFIYCPDTSRFGNIMEIVGNIYENPELLSGK
jgi:uncharacterized phage protein (TIGR01671 family)